MTPNTFKLPPVSGAPFKFDVTVEPPDADAQARKFTISEPGPRTGASAVRTYELTNTGHEAYLDLYAKLAGDFGICTPRNRREPQAPPAHTAYTPLLTRNLSASILYGYGDPAVLRVPDVCQTGSTYYLVVTSNDAPNVFPILRTRDMQNWEHAGFVFPDGTAPVWAAHGEWVSDFWAPEMHFVEGEFRLYFAARLKAGGELAIGVAKSPTPEGPFVVGNEPLITGGVIDPHLLVDPAGVAYLFWKEDTNDRWPALLGELLHDHGQLSAELFPDLARQRTASLSQALWPWIRTLHPMERFFALQPLIEATISDFVAFQARLTQLTQHSDSREALRTIARDVLHAMRTPVYAQRLGEDGVTLLGDRATVLVNDCAWEAHLVEGVWVARHGPRYYMFYAGNDFSTADYGIGVAISDAPLGPYVKSDRPLLRSTAAWSGPGHPSVAIGLDGKPQLFLHAFFPHHTGYKAFRALLTVPIAFENDRVIVREA